MRKTLSYKWDTTDICKFFNVDGATILEETYEAELTGPRFVGGMTGHNHSDETKKKISEVQTGVTRPATYKGGKIIKDGVVYEFTCLATACKELGLNKGHLSEMMNDKRRTVKGWRKYA